MTTQGAVAGDRRRRVTIVHNVIAPYRLPVFARLADDYDLSVVFCEATAPNRQWHGAGDELAAAPFTSVVLPSRRIGPGVVNRGARRSLRRFRPEALILADNDENSLTLAWLAILARLRRVPIVIWVEHVPDTSRGGRRPPALRAAFERAHRQFRRWLYRRAQAFLSMSGSASDRFLEQLAPPAIPVFTGTQVMPEGLLTAAPSSSEFTTPYIAFIGYLRPEKDVDVLISAFRAAPDVSARLLIAGTGPEAVALQAQAQGEPRIVFLGHLDGSRKADFLSNAELVVVPSSYEPWGMVVNEALAYGTPVACSTAVSARELPGCLSELQFQPRDAATLSTILRRFSHDDQWRDRLRCEIANSDRQAATDLSHAVRHFHAALDFVLPTSADRH